MSRRSFIAKFLTGVFATPLAAAWAFVAVIGGMRGLLDPTFNPVHQLLHGWDYAWAGIYLLAGLSMLIGSGTTYKNVEAGGVILFATGVFVQAIAYVAFLDFTFATGWVTVATFVAIGVCAIVRVMHLVRGEALVWVKRTKAIR